VHTPHVCLQCLWTCFLLHFVLLAKHHRELLAFSHTGGDEGAGEGASGGGVGEGGSGGEAGPSLHTSHVFLHLLAQTLRLHFLFLALHHEEPLSSLHIGSSPPPPSSHTPHVFAQYLLMLDLWHLPDRGLHQLVPLLSLHSPADSASCTESSKHPNTPTAARCILQL
jgi:hypothetical protein